MSVAAIIKQVKAYDCSHVVLTGGEPMIASGIRELAAALHAEGMHITIETAGTVTPSGIACDLASLSPKLANSTPDQEQAGPWQERHEATRCQPEVIRAWLEAYPCQLKFVVSAVEDLPEIESLLAEVGNVPGFTRDRVLLMPEGTDVAVLRERGPLIAELCLEHAFRFAPRLQIELFGNTRGT
jgi:7-carboxy-7-deazaguanine synthase